MSADRAANKTGTNLPAGVWISLIIAIVAASLSIIMQISAASVVSRVAAVELTITKQDDADKDLANRVSDNKADIRGILEKINAVDKKVDVIQSDVKSLLRVAPARR